MIIGIAGKKQVGKDTCFNFLNKEGNFENIKFADSLKDILCLLTGCSREDLESDEFKSKKMPSCWDCWRVSEYCEHDSLVNLFSTYEEAMEHMKDVCNPCTVGKVSYTYREALQHIGTNLFRCQFNPDVWIHSTLAKIKKAEGCIITDVRFPNEVEAIQKLGGKVILIKRDTGLNDHHVSENSLPDDDKFDYIIDNCGSLKEFEKKVCNMFVCIK